MRLLRVFGIISFFWPFLRRIVPFATSSQSVWKERNDRIFWSASSSMVGLLMVIFMISNRALVRKEFLNISMNDSLSN